MAGGVDCYLDVQATGVPSAASVGMKHLDTTLACYNSAKLAAGFRLLDVPAGVAGAVASSADAYFWDAEDMPANGTPFDLRTAAVRRCRRTLVQHGELQDAAEALVSGKKPTLYRGFIASLSAALQIDSNPQVYAEWVRSSAYAGKILDPYVTRAATDLYLFSWMAAYSTANFKAAVNDNIRRMQDAFPNSSELFVYVYPCWHPASASPGQFVGTQIWQDLNQELATFPSVRPILWGMLKEVGPPFTFWTWAEFVASGHWATFKTVWGLP